MVEEAKIRKEVEARLRASLPVDVDCSWHTPAGRPRKLPVYETEVRNRYLGLVRSVKGRTEQEVRLKAHEQLSKWAEQEIRGRIGDATQDAKARAAELSEAAAERLQSLREILPATLVIDDRIDWDAWFDRRPTPPAPPRPRFAFDDAPTRPQRSFLQFLLPSLWRKKLALWQHEFDSWQRRRHDAEHLHLAKVAEVEASYQRQIAQFVAIQQQRNEALARFRERFEAGDPQFIEEYVRVVFERSAYPECFPRDYAIAFDAETGTLRVDVVLPPQSAVPSTSEVKFDPRTKTLRDVALKKKEHDELYDSAVKQCLLRTIHEVFESVYVPCVEWVAVNGLVTELDAATGHDITRSILSLVVSRAQFEKLNLARISPDACIKSLRETAIETPRAASI